MDTMMMDVIALQNKSIKMLPQDNEKIRENRYILFPDVDISLFI